MLAVDVYLCQLLDLIQNTSTGFIIQNVGTGTPVYKGISGSGAREFRTISSNSIDITTVGDDIFIESTFDNVGDEAEIYKGISALNTKEFRTLKSETLDVAVDGDTVAIEMNSGSLPQYTVNNLGVGNGELYKDTTVNPSGPDVFNFKTIRSVDGTLTITQDGDYINIDQTVIQAEGGVRDFVVNTRYSGTEEKGTFSQPYKNLDNAIIAYIGNGDIDAPQYAYSRIFCTGGQSHSFLSSLSINTLILEVEVGTTITYDGADMYPIDFQKIQTALGGYGTQSNDISIIIQGEGILKSKKLLIRTAHSGHNRVTYPPEQWFRNVIVLNNIVLKCIYNDDQFVTGIKKSDGSLWKSNGAPASIYYGPIDNHAVVIEGGITSDPSSIYDNCLNVPFQSDNIYLQALTQIPMKVKDSRVIMQNTRITLSAYSYHVIVDPGSVVNGVITESPLGSDKLPTFRAGLTHIDILGKSSISLEGGFDDSAFEITRGEAMFIFKSDEINFKHTKSNPSDVNGGTTFEHYIKTGSYEPSILLEGVTVDKNLFDTLTGQFINTTVDPFQRANVKNCVFPFKLNAEVDLTMNNSISGTNYFENQLVLSLRKFISRAGASNSLPTGAEFINTANGGPQADWFIDIVV